MSFGLGFVSACVSLSALFWFGERIVGWVARPSLDVDMAAIALLIAEDPA